MPSESSAWDTNTKVAQCWLEKCKEVIVTPCLCESCRSGKPSGDLIRMWDGRDYCRTCIEDASPLLSEYRLVHPTLVFAEQTPLPTVKMRLQFLGPVLFGIYATVICILLSEGFNFNVFVMVSEAALVIAFVIWMIATVTAWINDKILRRIMECDDGKYIIKGTFRRWAGEWRDLSWSIGATPFQMRGGPRMQTISVGVVMNGWICVRERISFDTYHDHEVVLSFLQLTRVLSPHETA